MAAATSGDYENYFIKNKKRYSHIINPRTGYPSQEGVVAVTIISKEALITDALSTAVFVLGVDEGINLVEKIPQTYGLIICEDKKKPNHLKVFFTKGARQFFEVKN